MLPPSKIASFLSLTSAPCALQQFKLAVSPQIRFSSSVGSEQLLRADGSKRGGANKLLDGRRWVEHWIENRQVERPRFAGFEADNGERMSLVLEVYWRLACHVYLLVKVNEVITTEILAHREKKALVSWEIAVA